MATMAENVVAAGAENRPQILEKGMFNSWKTRIWIYIKGKENGEILLDSINKGPFQIKVEITVPSADGTTKEKLAQTVDDLSPKAKVYDMSMSKMQINTKFVYHLQSKWSRFVTAAKQARDLHVVKFDQFYKPPVVLQQPPTLPTQPDSGFVVPSFISTNDSIASLNKTMLFLSSAMTSRYPPTNNQLRTSSNPRTQATIQNGQVTVQNVQGRQSQGNAVNAGKSHMTKQCIVKKKVKDLEWFKEKMLLAQAQEARVVLHADQQDFLADRMEEMEDYCDDEATASAIFMASISPARSLNDDTVALTYDSDILYEVPTYNNYHKNDILNSFVQEMEYTEHFVSNNDSYDELTSDNNVISYANYMVTVENDAA
ncbi:hypothetical protein Tco_0838328 [Tanacetum coccineum]|uniref:Uncharacterized protein n=1 Tax=Tanacetum coccineum TaxID=301880 RepID=A0ABQ5ANH6_9ASTR